jgi:hypothetical protein
MVFESELCPGQTQHEGVVGRVDTDQAALEQPLGIGRTPAAQAFLGERRPVLDRVSLGEPLGRFAKAALRVDHRADVPDGLTGGSAVAQVREDLDEEVGKAASKRQRHDDE